MSSDESANAPGPQPSIPLHLLELRNLKLSAPSRFVLLIILSRQKALNIINEEMEDEMRQVMEWADENKDVW
jgi:enoyl-CoA hydratase/carnithine racemase